MSLETNPKPPAPANPKARNILSPRVELDEAAEVKSLLNTSMIQAINSQFQATVTGLNAGLPQAAALLSHSFKTPRATMVGQRPCLGLNCGDKGMKPGPYCIIQELGRSPGHINPRTSSCSAFVLVRNRRSLNISDPNNKLTQKT